MSPMTPASLSARITALLVVTSLLLLGSGAMWMDWRIDHEMESRFEQNLLTQANALSTMIALEQDALEEDGQRSTQPAGGLLGGDGPTYYELRCDGMPVLLSIVPPPATPADWPSQTGPQPRFSKLRGNGHALSAVQYSFAGAPRDLPDGDSNSTQPATQPAARQCRLLFEQDRGSIDQIMLVIDWVLTLGPALAMIIALLAVPLIVRRGLRPIDTLVEHMRNIGPNAPGQRLAASGLRELDPLVARFNDVLTRMDDGLARERQFASGLAHETRTRLAELRALTEVESRYPSGRSQTELLAEIGHIGAELEATVTALLLLTRLQSGIEKPQWQALPLHAWLTRQVQRQQGMATHRGVRLQQLGEPIDILYTDPALLEVVVGNLLGNAVAYAPPGDTLIIRTDAGGVTFDNAAPQLEAADLERFGERFWRKQAPHAGHAGLGLALAHAAAHALGLTLAYTLREGRLTASVRWTHARRPGADCQHGP